MMRTLRVAQLALSTALVMVATMMINVYVPATKGYFNLGETMIYFTALTMGAGVAAFAGGVGSALADIILGYGIYAPATLVIKALEGAAAGLLVEKVRRRIGARILLPISSVVVAGYFVIFLAIGMTLFAGELEFTLGSVTLKGFLHPLSWIPLAIAAVATPIYLMVKTGQAEGLLILSLLASGLIMVAGYFIYEQAILGFYALAEVPVNLGQVILGVAVAIPLYRAVSRVMERR